VRKVATLAGEPLFVDELSPMSVKLNYRDPSKLRGLLQIFFNKVRQNICFHYYRQGHLQQFQTNISCGF
jgi:hypothetical protein